MPKIGQKWRGYFYRQRHIFERKIISALSEETRLQRNINMTALIKMPLAVYQGLLVHLSSREYEFLKNSVVSHSPIYLCFKNVIAILCELDDAKLLLNKAKLFYPGAVSYIEEGIRVAGKGSSDVPQIKA